jgi:predicted ester cyclase
MPRAGPATTLTGSPIARRPEMDPQRNKALVRRFVEEYQSGADERAFDELMHPEFVDHSLPPGLAAGPRGVRQQFDRLRATFEGLRAEILQQVAEGDLVVTRKVFRGIHRGDFMGVAPTGREVELLVIDVVRLRDDRIVEHWNVVDLLGALMALGANPGEVAAMA